LTSIGASPWRRLGNNGPIVVLALTHRTASAATTAAARSTARHRRSDPAIAAPKGPAAKHAAQHPQRRPRDDRHLCAPRGSLIELAPRSSRHHRGPNRARSWVEDWTRIPVHTPRPLPSDISIGRVRQRLIGPPRPRQTPTGGQQGPHHRRDRMWTIKQPPRRPEQQNPHPPRLKIPRPRGRPPPHNAHLRTNDINPFRTTHEVAHS